MSFFKKVLDKYCVGDIIDAANLFSDFKALFHKLTFDLINIFIP